MKNTYLTLILILTTTIIYAQSPIIDIENYSFRESVENAYYKDINNFIDPFVGTWLYTNGNTSFKIVLTKETMIYTGKVFTDFLKGEYQYIENGEEKVNTLSNSDPYKEGLGGMRLIKSNEKPDCEDCQADERRISVIISDYERELSARFVLKLTTVNGQDAIRGFIYGGAPIVYDVEDPPPYFSMNVPDGTYIFIKQ